MKLLPFLDQEGEAFQKLIERVIGPSVRALPVEDHFYSVDTDASDYQLRAALFQQELLKVQSVVSWGSDQEASVRQKRATAHVERNA